MNAPARFSLRRLSLGTAILAALTAGGLLAMAFGLLGLVRGLEAGLLVPLVLAGLAAGGLISRARIPAGAALGLLAAGGALVLVLFAGALAGRLGSLAWALLRTRPDLPAWLGGHYAAFEPLRLAWADLSGGLGVFSARIAAWTTSARQGSPIFDPLIPTLTWGWAAWLAAGWAGWSLGRRFTAVAALFPALALLAGGCGFTRFDPTALITLLGCLVAASILFAAVHREQAWTARGLDYSTETRLDLAEVSIPLVVLVVGVSAILPLLSWETLFERPRPQTQPPGSAETVLRSFGLQLPTHVPTVLDSYFTPGLPRQHLIGSGPELTRRVALTVRLLDPAPAAAPRPYWREFTYDRYLGSGWQTSGTQAGRIPAGALLAAGAVPGGAARFEIHPGPEASGILIYTGTLLSADRDVTLQSRSSGDLFAGYLQPGSYIVTAARPAYDPAQLRAAGQDYPDGVKRAYLQLPASTSNRVVSLVRELTAAQATPYDRAAAIESYLRALPYTLDLPAPPPGRDIADYFLFDLKKGYCDYFATAMAVLARTAGIPARLVVGYAPGQYDPAARTFTVRESDAHSWTELYFPGYGWVEFDPTPGIGAGEAALPPAGVPPSIPEPAPPAVSPVESLARAAQRVPWGWAAAVLAAAGLLLAAASERRARRLLGLPAAEGLQQMYDRLARAGFPRGERGPAGLTPYETSARLTGGLRGEGWLGRWILPAKGEIEALVGLYVQSAYSPREVTPREFRGAFRQWRRLQLRLAAAAIVRFLKK